MAIVGRTPTVAEAALVTSVTGILPTDRVTGDLVVASFHMSTTVAAFTGPGGSWVQLVAPTANAANQIVAVYYQFDPASAPVGSTSGAADRQTCICQAYGGVDPTNPVDVAAAISTAAGTPLAVTGITTVTDGARLVSGATVNASNGTWTIPATMTLVAQHTSGTGRGGAVADETFATAGATGTRTWVWSGAGLTMVGYLAALRPAAAAGQVASYIPRVSLSAPLSAITRGRLVANSFGGLITGGGGQTFTRNLAGSVTPAGSLAKAIAKPSLAGSVTPAGALAKQANKALAGSVTPTGVLTAVKVVLRTFAGSVTPTGALAKQVNKALAGSSTATGTLTRQAAKVLAGSVTSAGSLAKAIAKALSGSSTPTGVLSTTRVILRSFAGAVTPTGILTRQTNKALTGAVTPTGVIRKAVSRALSGVVTATGALRKATAKPFAGSSTPTGSVSTSSLGATQNATSTAAVTALRSATSTAGSATTSTPTVGGQRSSTPAAGSAATSSSTVGGKATSTPNVSDG